MSTQISSIIDDSYLVFQRILSLLQESNIQENMLVCQEKLGSQQFDKTFEESVMKFKQTKINDIAIKLESSLLLHIKNENNQNEKYEDLLQALEDKLRRQTKTQIQSRLLIEALEEENNQMRRQILILKDRIIELQSSFEGTQQKMKTQIKILQTQISNLKKLDNLIWESNRNSCNSSKQQEKIPSQKKKNTISMIKNRLSLCSPKQFHANFYDCATPHIYNQVNRTVQRQQKTMNTKLKKKIIKSTSRRSSMSLLTRKSSIKNDQIKQNEKNTINKSNKSKKNQKIKQLNIKTSLNKKVQGCNNKKMNNNKSVSKIKVKK